MPLALMVTAWREKEQRKAYIHIMNKKALVTISNPCFICNRDYIFFDCLHFITSSLSVFILFLKSLSKTCVYFYLIASVSFFFDSPNSQTIFQLRQITPSMNSHQPSVLYTNVPENTYFLSASPVTVLSMM